MLHQLKSPMASTNSPKRLKIFFASVESAGHLSACYGLANSLVKRDHHVSFFLDARFKGQAEKFGCREIVFVRKPAEKAKIFTRKSTESVTEAVREIRAPMLNPLTLMADQIRSQKITGPMSTLEKMRALTNRAFFKQVYETMLHQCEQINAAIEAQQPDLFIFNGPFVPPAVASMKHVLIFTSNPLSFLNSPKLPPGCSGYRTDSDPETWTELGKHITEVFLPMVAAFQGQLNAHFNYTGATVEYRNVHRNINVSPYLNLYAIPKELDYTDIEDSPENFLQLDGFCQLEAKPFSLPQAVQDMPGKALIYFSLGAVSGIDLELMQRLLAIFAKTPYKYIVSKGPRHAEIQLPANCWGEQYLPQAAILPLVELVITHGCSNTVAECFTFGKKMIILGLFADQLDNGARVSEKCLGAAFDPYDFEEEQLVEAIDRLVADEALTERMKAIAQRIASDDTKTRACEAIEQLCA